MFFLISIRTANSPVIVVNDASNPGSPLLVGEGSGVVRVVDVVVIGVGEDTGICVGVGFGAETTGKLTLHAFIPPTML